MERELERSFRKSDGIQGVAIGLETLGLVYLKRRRPLL